MKTTPSRFTSRNKYGVAKKHERTWDGRTYDSKAECLYAQELALMQRSGDVIEVIEQPTVMLGCAENIYRPDFLVVPGDKGQDRWMLKPFYVDVKGRETPKFRRDKKLWREHGRLDLLIVERKNNLFRTKEAIRVEKEPHHEDE